MEYSRFVEPQQTILKISHDQTLTVKRRLTSGEQRAMLSRMYLTAADGSLHVNPLETSLGVVLAYLLDWTVTDRKGTLVEIRGLGPIELTAVLDALSPEDFAEIKAAIDAHIKRENDERDAEKNGRGGESTLPATSPSPVDSTGVTNGSLVSTPM